MRSLHTASINIASNVSICITVSDADSFFSMSKKPSVIHKIERHLKSKLPNILQKILINCGFDNEASIKLINEDTIVLLEDYINKNKNIFLKKTNYKEDEKFEFSIGHKILILNLPKFLEQIENEKEKENNREEDNVYIQKIVTKLENHVKKFNYDFTVTNQFIENFKKTESGFKCHVKCPVCSALSSCLFKKGLWNTSNFSNHLKNHYPRLPLEKQPTNETVFVAVTHENSGDNLLAAGCQSIQRTNNTDLLDLLNVSTFDLI